MNIKKELKRQILLEIREQKIIQEEKENLDKDEMIYRMATVMRQEIPDMLATHEEYSLKFDFADYKELSKAFYDETVDWFSGDVGVGDDEIQYNNNTILAFLKIAIKKYPLGTKFLLYRYNKEVKEKEGEIDQEEVSLLLERRIGKIIRKIIRDFEVINRLSFVDGAYKGNLKLKYKDIDKVVYQINNVDNRDKGWREGEKRNRQLARKRHFNPKENLLDKLSGYVKRPGNPWYYIHMTDIEGSADMMFNPSSRYNTPLGVYSYPLSQEIFSQIKRGRLPFRGHAKYMLIFKPEDNFQNLIFHIGKDEVKDETLARLKSMFGRQKEVDFRTDDFMSYINHYIVENGIDMSSVFAHPNNVERCLKKLFIENKEQFKDSYSEFGTPHSDIVYSDLLDFIKEYYKFYDFVSEFLETKIISEKEIFEFYQFISNFYLLFEDVMTYFWDKINQIISFAKYTQEIAILRPLMTTEFGIVLSSTKKEIEKAQHFAKLLGNQKKNIRGIIQSGREYFIDKVGANPEDTKIMDLWSLSRGLSTSSFNWSKILTELGFFAFHDHGEGIIHLAEKEQAVFFVPRYLETIELIENPIRYISTSSFGWSKILTERDLYK